MFGQGMRGVGNRLVDLIRCCVFHLSIVSLRQPRYRSPLVFQGRAQSPGARMSMFPRAYQRGGVYERGEPVSFKGKSRITPTTRSVPGSNTCSSGARQSCPILLENSTPNRSVRSSRISRLFPKREQVASCNRNRAVRRQPKSGEDDPTPHASALSKVPVPAIRVSRNEDGVATVLPCQGGGEYTVTIHAVFFPLRCSIHSGSTSRMTSSRSSG